MAFHGLKEDDTSFLTGRSYTHAIRLALVFLLLGGGFLAVEKFLERPHESEMRFPLARITEVLGWIFLGASTVILSREVRGFFSESDTDTPIGPLKLPEFEGFDRQELERLIIERMRQEAKDLDPADFERLRRRLPIRSRLLLSQAYYGTDAARNEGTKREEAIDKLYSELRPLLSRAATDPSLRKEARRKLSLLRKLQDEEADEIEKRFEAGLLLKPGEGYRALERADEILARYEDPSSAHAATQHKD